MTGGTFNQTDSTWGILIDVTERLEASPSVPICGASPYVVLDKGSLFSDLSVMAD